MNKYYEIVFLHTFEESRILFIKFEKNLKHELENVSDHEELKYNDKKEVEEFGY